MFHSVGDEHHEFNVSINSFERFIESIKGSNIVRLEDYKKGNNFICLTFDDVADSFYYNAYPLLKKNKIPFTIFVSCDLLDREHYLSTAMLKEVSECDLCTIGSHGWHHSYYTDLKTREIEDELSSSRARLEELTNKKVELFAFPFGSIYACGLWNRKYVKKYYRYGFGTISAPVSKVCLLPDYYLPRICVN